MQPIAEWLEKLGLGQYAQRFAENGIDFSVLRHLTDQDLKDIDVLLGHRRKMLAAIAELSSAVSTALEPTAEVEPKAHDAAERRQLTVMFCDLVGSTALSAKLDPEDLRGIIGAYHCSCTEMIEGNGGFVAKYMGDGVLAYFGYPQAHEHDAELAVRAGLAVVKAVPKLATNVGAPLQARVGIATGLAVVGDLIGAGAAQEQAVVGETPNLSARLQALAEPDTVVINDGTRRLLGALFEYRALGTVPVKGFGDHVMAWQVLGASKVDSRFEALRSDATPLVGRAEELELLMRRWQQVKSGQGRAVLITGEPGIGKSRLAATLQEHLQADAHTRLRYFCSPHYQDTALYPFMAQLEHAAGFAREDAAEAKLEKLEALLVQSGDCASETVGLFADLLALPANGRYPPLPADPQRKRELTLEALVRQLEGLAARRPVLLVFEDAQWADSTSLELLDRGVERVAGLPVLMLITFRPEFQAPWVGQANVSSLSLSRLARRETVALVGAVAGGKCLPAEIIDHIVKHADGIPLFIEELTKTLLEGSLLREEESGYALVGPLPP